MGVKRLINMVLVAAVQLVKPRVVNGTITRYEIRLPRKPDGTEQRLGKGPYQASLQWPPYFEPSLDDANKAVTAAIGAKTTGFVDDQHIAKFLAPFFQVEDVDQVVTNAKSQSNEAQAEIERMALAGPETPSVDTTGVTTEKEQDSALNGAQVTALADLVKAVALGELPAASAIEIIIVGFPVQRDVAEKMVNAAAAGVKQPDTKSNLILP